MFVLLLEPFVNCDLFQPRLSFVITAVHTLTLYRITSLLSVKMIFANIYEKDSMVDGSVPCTITLVMTGSAQQ